MFWLQLLAPKSTIMKKTIFSVLFLSSLLQVALAQVTPISGETVVNNTVANSQQNPAIATDANDNYVIVWESFNQDGSGFGIYAQRYDNTGTQVGSETLVNTTTANDQRFPAIAIDDTGNYTIVWQSFNQDGDGWGTYGQQFDNTGASVNTEFLINTTTTGQQRFPDIAMDDSGNFVVVWESEFDVYLQYYNNLGTAQGSETLINATTASSQNYPAVAMDSDGDFVITWQSLDQDGSDYGIYAQTYDNTGAVQTSEFLVNTTTTDNQLSPDVAIDDNGNFTIVWTSNLQDGSQEGIYAQQFDDAANPINSEFLVNTTTTGTQDHPNINMTTTGDFIIVWNSYDQDGSRYGTYFKGYNADGLITNKETLVNTTTTLFQQFAAVGLNARTTATFVWQDGQRASDASLDTDDYGIVQRRYDVAALPVELLYFSGKAVAEGVQLNWETAIEINNDHFEVQWSLDAKTFKTVGKVKGAGTTTEPQQYNFLHPFPAKSVNYYRLKQMDFDGTFAYSKTIAISLEQSDTKQLLVFPNPSTDIVYYQLSDLSTIERIQLYNVAGQLLYENVLSNGALSLEHLASGHYVLMVETDRRTYSVTVVRE
jgi:hypothetical protein